MRHLSLWLFFSLLACSEYDLVHEEDPNTIGDGTDNTDADGNGIPDVEEMGGISGRICATDEASYVSDAEVWTDTSLGKVAAFTDADGYFELTGIPGGTYDITAEKGSFLTTFNVLVVPNQVTELQEEECIRAEDLNVAVVTGAYDSIENILDRLNIDFDLIEGEYGYDHVDLLRDPAALSDYNIIFFNCGMHNSWLNYQSEVGSNLRTFVKNGGSIYASDWAYYIAEATFPEMQTFVGNDSIPGDAYVGEAGYITANVVDEGMKKALESNTASINFDLAIWAAIEKSGSGTPLIRGTYAYFDWASWNYIEVEAPLATRLDDGDGTLLYTSFHNEEQNNTMDMDKLLQEIIYSL